MSHSPMSGIATEMPNPPLVVVEPVEERVLADRLVALEVDVLVDGHLVDLDQRAAEVLHVVERAGLHQRLDHPLVADERGHLAHEVVEVEVAALLRARRHDRRHHVGADVADRGEPEPDVGADGGERRLRLVDVGRQHLDLHPATLVEVDRHLVLVVLHRGEERRHVLRRVVRLEVGGPVRDEAVRRGVGLVEGVVGERHQGVPQRLDRAVGVAVGLHPLGEGDVLGVEHLLLLLAHRPAQQVGLSEAVARELAGRLHDLLLVDDQAVGLAEDLGQRLRELGVDRRDVLLAVLAERVVGVAVDAHRPGPVERQHRGDVLEAVGLHQPQQAAHRAAVELEDPERVAGAEQRVGRRRRRAAGPRAPASRRG